MLSTSLSDGIVPPSPENVYSDMFQGRDEEDEALER